MTVAALELRRVSKWYGVVQGVSDVSVSLSGGVVGLLGVNGAGKSTLMKLAAGLLRPSLGDVSVFGLPPADVRDVRRRIGLCPDVDQFYERMTGLAWVTFMAKLLGVADARQRAAAALERLGMKDRMDTKIGGYSKGMRQRTKLARALVSDADLLLLDEPLNGLDPVGRHEMVGLIRELGAEGKSVLVSSHVLAEVEQMTRALLLIHQGRLLAEGTIEEIRNQLLDRAHLVEVRARDLRGLAARLIEQPSIEGVDVMGERLVVKVRDAEAFFDHVTRSAAEARHGVEAVVPLDAGLEAVFDYLVKK
jgi:ABC-2 type transport system ATP-binding protein